MWKARVAAGATAVVGLAAAVDGSLNPDTPWGDFRGVCLSVAIVASVLFVVRCHARSMGDVFEQGRIQGRREVIAELNTGRRYSPDPIPLAEHRTSRRPVRV